VQIFCRRKKGGKEAEAVWSPELGFVEGPERKNRQRQSEGAGNKERGKKKKEIGHQIPTGEAGKKEATSLFTTAKRRGGGSCSLLERRRQTLAELRTERTKKRQISTSPGLCRKKGTTFNEQRGKKKNATQPYITPRGKGRGKTLLSSFPPRRERGRGKKFLYPPGKGGKPAPS